MATRIIPRLVRGRLYFQTADVLFPTLKGAICAHAACEAQRLDVDALIVQRTEALAEMRRAGDDFAAFSVTSKREAFLAAQIRQLRRQGGAA